MTFSGEGPGARRHRVRPNYLGVAKDNDNFFSRLSLYWANPLIKKGRQGKISGPADVFDLPASMNTMILSQRFQMLRSEYSRRGDIPLLRMLIRAFGRPFLGVGVLKFIADCAGFASPILLNLVITFMEDEKTEMKWGYIYAGSLALSTFVVALCNTHFNLQMSELGLRMRASIITAVYRQTLGVTSLNLSTFSTGQVINFMTTDTDRVVNFSPSLHAAWSLPFQFAVTLFLLYQQVTKIFL